MAIPGDTGGYCWVASLRAALRAKDGGSWVMLMTVGGSTLMKCGGGSLSSGRLETEEAGDSLDWLIDPSANIVYQWLGQ